MKIYMVEYTEDYLETKQTLILCAKNSAEARVLVSIELGENAVILDVFEII